MDTPGLDILRRNGGLTCLKIWEAQRRSPSIFTLKRPTYPGRAPATGLWVPESTDKTLFLCLDNLSELLRYQLSTTIIRKRLGLRHYRAGRLKWRGHKTSCRDFTKVEAGSGSYVICECQPLLERTPRYRDIGLHFCLSRHVGLPV